MADLATTQIWEKHFGNSAAVPFGENVVPFLNDLSDDIEKRECQDISDRAAFGLASPDEMKRMAAMMDSYRRRNGREMIIVRQSKD